MRCCANVAKNINRSKIEKKYFLYKQDGKYTENFGGEHTLKICANKLPIKPHHVQFDETPRATTALQQKEVFACDEASLFWQD